MTTEDDFQRQLDADPANHVLRTIFADWLQDQGDERAEGYRALGALRLFASDSIVLEGKPIEWLPHNETCWFKKHYPTIGERWELPGDWFSELSKPESQSGGWSEEYPNAKAAEDDAARAFAKLPAERRAELLSLQPAGVA